MHPPADPLTPTAVTLMVDKLRIHPQYGSVLMKSEIEQAKSRAADVLSRLEAMRVAILSGMVWYGMVWYGMVFSFHLLTLFVEEPPTFDLAKVGKCKLSICKMSIIHISKNLQYNTKQYSHNRSFRLARSPQQ